MHKRPGEKCGLDVATVGRVTLEQATRRGLADFEDAVIVESARGGQADYIVTRNLKDFAKSPIPVHTPESFRALLDRIH